MSTTQTIPALTPLPIPTEADLRLLKRYDAGVRCRALIEIGVVRTLVKSLIDSKHCLTVDDGGDEYALRHSTDVEAIMDALFAVEAPELLVYQLPAEGWTPPVPGCVPDDGPVYLGSIDLIFGNSGWDVISDYTISLEERLAPANAYAEAMSEWRG